MMTNSKGNSNDDTSPPPPPEISSTEMSESAVLAAASESTAAAVREAANVVVDTGTDTDTGTGTDTVTTCTDIVKHMLNLGAALKCPVCYGTVQDPVCLAQCMHAFCRSCIQQSLTAATRKNECPLCKKTATRRSLLDCPELQRLAQHYKKALPSFGLVGAEYSADVQMTQFEVLPGGEGGDDSDDNSDDSDSDDCSQHGTDLEDSHELWQVSLTMQRALQEGMEDPDPVPQLQQQQQHQHQQHDHSHGHPPNSESARRASAIAAITAANNRNNKNSKSNNGEQKWVLSNVERVIEVNRQAFERLQAKATQQQQQRQQKLQQQQQQQLVLSQIVSSQNMHAAREQENADALEEDNDREDEDEQEWNYPGQYYERANAKVTFAEVFGGEEEKEEEEDDDRKLPASRAAVHADNHHPANNNNVSSLKVFGEEDNRKMPPALLSGHADTTANDDNDNDNANGGDGDESSLEEFQSAVQELPVEPHMPTAQAARLPFVREEEEESNSTSDWNGVTPGRRRKRDDDADADCRNDSLGSNMSTAKTPFRSNKTSSSAAHHQQVPARLLVPVIATLTTTPTTDLSRLEASPVSLHDRQAATPIPTASESSKSEPVNANSPNWLLRQEPEDCSTEDVPFDEDLPVPMQGVVNDTTLPVQEDVRDSYQAVEVPVIVQQCGPTANANANANANDARVLETDGNNNNNDDDAQAVSVGDVRVVSEIPTADSNDARVLESDENNDIMQAVSATDVPVEGCPTANGNPRASSVPSHAATTLAVETPAAQQQHFAKSVYAVGTIVQVQARTWPGVNKHGGVARITLVNTSSDGSVRYNVKYVLGGGETKLEEIFVSLHNDERGTKEVDEEEQGVGTSGARKSHRLESKEDSIPPDVLANLKAEGFDVKGVAVPSDTDSGVRRLTKQFTLGNTSGNTKSLNVNQRSSKRKLRPAESGPAVSKENAKPAAKNAPGRRKPHDTAPVAAKGSSKTLNNTVANKRKSAASLGNAKGKKRRTALPSTVAPEGIQLAATVAALELTNEQKCESADVLYMDSIRAAIQKGVIYVVTSGLSETDTEALKKLCKGTKSNDVQVKLTESFNSEKTTLCVVSVDPRVNRGNLLAGKRTLKAMQATRAGVPLISPAWITSFGDSNQFVLPDSSMFVRTLPTKTSRGDEIMDFGVSAIAAAIRSSRAQAPTFQFKVLTDISVYLCGRFETTISKLLREAGAEVLTASKAVAKLSADGDQKVVLLCSDNDCKIPGSVESKVEIHKSQVQVVNVDWLFDSISCGSVLAASAYAPKVKQAKELWAITMDI